MAQSVIGALRVNLGLDSAKFERGAKRVKSPLKAMRAQFLAVAASAPAFGVALTSAAIKGAQEIDRVAKSARRLDASIAGFRAIELAASEAGVPLSGLTNDIQNMNREIANIGTSGNAARALDRLGLSADDLAGLDADQKIAKIADTVKALGLDAGQATTVLRDLGVRGREMVLLMLQGGDAMRAARRDVEQYGLALSSVDAAKIEQANDRIGRLALVGKYAGQQLALALVPVLGSVAQAMTESLRTGGTLRAVIDSLVASVQRVSTYMATAVGIFGVRYVGALVAARLSTMTFAGSLVALRGALIRTGVGALIVGAGELVYQFSRLVQGAGSFGEALAVLKELALEVWGRIGDGTDYVVQSVAAMAFRMKASFIQSIGTMAGKFVEFTWTVADGLNGLFGTNLSGASARITQSLQLSYKEAEKAANAASEAATAAGKAFSAPLNSIKELRNVVSDTAEKTEDAATAAERLDQAISNANGGGASGVAKAMDGVASAAKTAADTIRQSMTDSFKGVLSKAMTFREGLANIFRKIADMMLDSVGNFLFSGVSSFIGNALTSSIPGFAAGTDSAPGGAAWVGEQGRELVNLPRGSQVIPNHKINGGGAPAKIEVHPSPYFDVRVGALSVQANQPQIRTVASMGQQSHSARNSQFHQRGTMT